MPEQVVESWLKGNYGEHLVAQVLSQSCLVRPVVGQTDIGVDLYCESIIHGKPFLHFWAQVKSSRSFANEAVEVSCPFSVSALQYWARQPVPVLGFLVPTQWPPENIDYIHVVDITFDILEYGIADDQESQTLTSKPRLILPTSDTQELSTKLTGLLLHHIPMIVSAMYAEKGFIYPAPKPKDEYVKYFAAHFLSRYIRRIELRTRHAVTFGIMQFLNAGYSVDDLPEILLAALETLEDDPHCEVQEALGVVSQARGDIARARSYYEKAIRYIMDDPNTDHSNPPWSESISRLDKRIRSLD